MSERDSDAPSDESWSDADAPKSEPPAKPAADGIRRIDTMLGSHLPGLIEQDVLEQVAAAQEPKPDLQPVPRIEPRAQRLESEPDAAPGNKWKSPLQVGPDWLVALKSIPPKLVAIAVGGIAIGVLFTLSIRGCGENKQMRDLDERVALLERTVGVSLDGGRVNDPSSIATSNDAGNAVATLAASTSASTATIAPTNDACADAKNAAVAAWQTATAKAKQIAAPAEGQCKNILTSQHRQNCMTTASAGVRQAQSARDTVMKGGAAARDAVKNVHDDGRNGAIATAKAASQTAFTACDDGNEL